MPVTAGLSTERYHRLFWFQNRLHAPDFHFNFNFAETPYYPRIGYGDLKLKDNLVTCPLVAEALSENGKFGVP